MSAKLVKRVFLLVVATSLIFSAGYYFGKFGLADPRFVRFDFSSEIKNKTTTASPDFGLFWNVWDMVGKNYFDSTKLSTSEMIYGAIKGMVAAIGDPYTVFLTPSENKTVEDDLNGSFEGVGIQIGFKKKDLTVITPLPNSPAKEAGVLAGDVILAIKDEKKGINQSTYGMSIDEAVALIKGPRGTEVTLLIAREGEDKAKTITIKRAKIEVLSVELEYSDEVAHLKVLRFSSDTKAEWEKAVSVLMKSSTDRLILDLRSNPGGYMQGAVDLASDFLPTNTLVVIEDSKVYGRTEYKTKGISRLAKYKVVILVDGGSASASEIMAAALREQAKIKIVGEKSFGKGTIQEPKDLAQNSGIHITIGKWLTPEGVWLNEKGLEPDVVVADNPDTPEDEQLEKALEIVMEL